MRDLGEERKELWVGTEVEGRWSGLRTLFIATPRVDVLAVADFCDAAHVYYLWEAWARGEQEFWMHVDAALDAELPASFEVPFELLGKLPLHIANHPAVRLQVTIPIGDDALAAIKLLRPMDEIRLDASPFNVATVEKRLLHIVTPDEYDGDESL